MNTSADHQASVRALLARKAMITNRDVVAHLRVSAATAQRVLSDMVEAGVLEMVGHGPLTAYVFKAIRRRFAIKTKTEESVLWDQVEDALGQVVDLGKIERDVLRYTATEMLNNAIDHSSGSSVHLSAQVAAGRVDVCIQDNGVGVFVRARQNLPDLDPRDVVVQLEKGKLTTDPARHTGQGLFFSSKAVSRFMLESEKIAWIVDNIIGDRTIGPSKLAKGTRVTLSVVLGQVVPLKQTFDAWTDPETLKFHRSQTTVRLIDTGSHFVSRSEAKRIAARLEEFVEVIVDFGGVEMVGQGFCDELFRVWARAHPATRLVPIQMSRDVDFMVRRSLVQ